MQTELINKLQKVAEYDGEVWVDIAGYNGAYQVSNMGRVRSVDRYKKYTNIQGTKNRFIKGCLLKQQEFKGYLRVTLVNNPKYTHYFVHRLVGAAFIKNPENKRCINHIDCNPKNNNVSNLEWATHAENNRYTHLLKRHKTNKATCSNAVLVFKNGVQCFEFVSIKEAARKLGFPDWHISGCLRGKAINLTYQFRYKNPDNIWSNRKNKLPPNFPYRQVPCGKIQ